MRDEQQNGFRAPISMTLFLASIPFDAKDEELRELLEACGKVTKFAIVRDIKTQQSKGYAFADMPDSRQAQAAIAALNGWSFGRRKLKVEEARQSYHDQTPQRSEAMQRTLDEVAS